MLELDCKICFYSLDKNKFLPRMLSCGHTFCSPCISELIETSKLCPTCRRPFTSESINDYPVNYIVLEMKYSAKDLEKNKEKFIEKYKSKLLILKKDFGELKPIVTKLKGIFESSEKQLDKLIETSDDINTTSKDDVKEIEKTLETIRKQIKPGSVKLLSLSIQLQDYKSNFDIIADICKEIADHKTLAAVSVINGVKKFAKISLKDNFIFLHAFETSQELDEDEDEIFTFSFVDLLNRFCEMNENKTIYGFLDMSYQTKSTGHRVMIEIMKSAMDLGASFLKLCSGERNVSYRGCIYSQKYKDKNTSLSSSPLNSHITSVDVDKIIQIKQVDTDTKSFIDESLYSKYLDSNLGFAGCSFDTSYLSFKGDGSFEIFKLYNKVGNVVVQNGHASHCQMRNNPSYAPICAYCQVCVPFYNRNPRSFMDAGGNVITLSDDVYHMPNVVGQIIDDKKNFESTFKDATFGKVLDCGLAFSL